MIYKDFDKTVKKLLIDNDIQLNQVAHKLGESPQNLNGKLNRETIRLVDAEKILDAIGYELTINKKKD